MKETQRSACYMLTDTHAKKKNRRGIDVWCELGGDKRTNSGAVKKAWVKMMMMVQLG